MSKDGCDVVLGFISQLQRGYMGNASYLSGYVLSRDVKSKSLARRALSLDPSLSGAHNTRRNIYMEKGFLKGAMAEFQKALTLKPDFAEALYNLGRVYLYQGWGEKAANAYCNLGGICTLSKICWLRPQDIMKERLRLIPSMFPFIIIGQ